MTLAEIWPVRRLRVTTSVLELAVPGEDELAELAIHAAAGIYDPQNRFLARSPVAGCAGGTGPLAKARTRKGSTSWLVSRLPGRVCAVELGRARLG